MNRTGTVVAILLALGVSWEVWTLVNSVPGDTISETVWAAIHDNPIIVFVVGILNGHWFWLSASRSRARSARRRVAASSCAPRDSTR
jgi:hypothetical protein